MTLFLSFVVLILSIIAHEVAHGYAADYLGDPTARLAGRLTLNPISHIDTMGSIFIPLFLILSNSPFLFGWAKPVPYNPYNLRAKRWGEALVAIAGSATNLFLAVIFGLVLRYGEMLGFGSTALSIAAIITFTNLFLGLFNLLPFPPLDGFTALRAALPWHLATHLTHFEQKIRASGIFALILFLLVFSFFFSGPFFKVVVWLFQLVTGLSI